MRAALLILSLFLAAPVFSQGGPIPPPGGGPIEVTSLVLTYEDGSQEEIMRDGLYTIF